MTNIEWVKNPDGTQGMTANPITGCKNHTPEGLCLDGLFPCYAYKLANTRLKKRYLAKHHWTSWAVPRSIPALFDPFYPRWWPERLDKIRGLKKPTGIFLDDMSDWMGDYWPEEWTRQEIQVMRDCPQHRFYTLTKQPQNLIKWSPFPENCWVGVTATSAYAWTMAPEYLSHIEASVRFVSVEPMLEQLSSDVIGHDHRHWVDWLVIGACTGTMREMVSLCERRDNELVAMRWGNRWTAQPQIQWVREIVQAADKAGVKVFLKNNLSPLLVQVKDDNEYAERWANGGYGTLRQELPKK